VAAVEDDPGRVAARLVQRAAEILGEEMRAARARGARRGDASGATGAPPHAPVDDPATARDDPVDDLRDAVGVIVERLLEAVDTAVRAVVETVGTATSRPSGDGGPGRPAHGPAGPDPVPVHLTAGPVAPGTTATVVVAVPPDPDGRRRGPFVASALLGPGRGRIPARAVQWVPSRIEEAGAGGVVVTVAVPPATAVGEYRMLLRGPAGFEAVVGVTVGR